MIWIWLELGLDGMDFDGAVQIFILSFSWKPNKDWKRTEKWFAWVWGWGLWNLWFFFYGVFMLNFLGLWIWFLGLWILFIGAFVVDWKMRKSRFELWFCISGFCGLRKSTARFVFVFLLEINLCLCLVDKKGQENVRKSRHVFLCLKSGFVFFGVLVKDEHRSWCI